MLRMWIPILRDISLIPRFVFRLVPRFVFRLLFVHHRLSNIVFVHHRLSNIVFVHPRLSNIVFVHHRLSIGIWPVVMLQWMQVSYPHVCTSVHYSLLKGEWATTSRQYQTAWRISKAWGIVSPLGSWLIIWGWLFLCWVIVDGQSSVVVVLR